MHILGNRLIVVLLSLICLSTCTGGQTIRLTNNAVRKPCIVVSGDGSRLVWIEQHDRPAPDNTVYLVKTASVKVAAIEDLMVLPAVSSNLKPGVVGTDGPLVGPHFSPSDLNYRVMGVFPMARLSRDGGLLVVSVVEVFHTVVRHPFFVIFDLTKGTHRIVAVEVPDSMGQAAREHATVEFHPMHWDLHPAGTHIVYLLDTTTARHPAAAVMLIDLAGGQGRKIIGYDRVAIENNEWVIEGPADQRVLYGSRLVCGDSSVVVAARNAQGQDGLWVAPLGGGAPIWVEAAYAAPGIASGHVYYRGQTLASWLGPDSRLSSSFPQNVDIDNSGSVPFWAGGPAVYVVDRDRRNLLRIAGETPQPLRTATDFSLPDQWRFRLVPNSSDESFRLTSEDGNALLLPAEGPDGAMDLFLATFETPPAAVLEIADTNASRFESQVDGFEVGSLLRPGELTPRWLRTGNHRQPSDAVASGQEPNGPAAALPDPWIDPMVAPASTVPPVTAVAELKGETAETAYSQASLLAMQRPLTGRRLAQVVERLESAVRKDPNNRLYRLELAQAYLGADTTLSVAAAIEHYCVLLARDNKDDDALSGLADAYAQLGDLELAFQLAFLRPQQNPGKNVICRSAATQIAAMALEAGDLPGGLTYLRELRRLHPQEYFLEGMIGLVWQLQGDAARARAILSKVADESPPGDPVAGIAAQIRNSLKTEGGAQ